MTTPQVTAASSVAATVLDEVERAVVGKREALTLVLAAVLAKGHVLLEDFPGLGKTLAARSFAGALGLEFSRAQFTPDLLPADLTGSFLYNQREGSFEFRRGPLFTGLLLADEINRTPPKTQAALLEAMQERQITVEGETFPLPEPFHVLATANPIEQEGTYPLPEAQLDRFMFLVDVGYPTAEEEVEIVKSTTGGTPPPLEKILSPERILALQALVRKVPVPDHVVRYAVELVRHTRPKEPGVPDFIQKNVSWGAGPRASQYLVLAAKARAILGGRFVASVEDVKAVARPVLRHRVLPNFTAESEGTTSVKLIDQLLTVVKG